MLECEPERMRNHLIIYTVISGTTPTATLTHVLNIAVFRQYQYIVILHKTTKRHAEFPFVYRTVQRQKLNTYDTIYLLLGLKVCTQECGPQQPADQLDEALYRHQPAC